MDTIFAQLEKKVDKVVLVVQKLKEENANLKSINQELSERLRQMETEHSGGDGAVRQLRSRMAKLEVEHKSFLELRGQIEARLEAVLSQFDWLEE